MSSNYIDCVSIDSPEPLNVTQVDYWTSHNQRRVLKTIDNATKQTYPFPLVVKPTASPIIKAISAKEPKMAMKMRVRLRCDSADHRWIPPCHHCGPEAPGPPGGGGGGGGALAFSSSFATGRGLRLGTSIRAAVYRVGWIWRLRLRLRSNGWMSS